MEHSTLFQSILRDIGIGEGIVSTGAVEENPVNAGNCHHNTVRGGAFFVYHQTACPIGRQNVLDHGAKGIVTNFTQKTDIRTQQLQSQAGVGNTSAGGNIRCVHMDQPSGNHQLTNIGAMGSLGKYGSDINTDMSRRNDFLLHVNISPKKEIMVSLIHYYKFRKVFCQ